MNIQLKLFASLESYLPPNAARNAASIEVADGATPHQVIQQYRVPLEEAHLVLINGSYVEPEDRDKPVLREGDSLAIWPPVAGG